jgi:hypothetical protein
MPEDEPLSVDPLDDDPVPLELPRLVLPGPVAELPVPVELPEAPLAESWTPNALAVLLSNCPLC